MNALIHGHEVLNRILEAKGPLSVPDLLQQLEQSFGPDPRFFTCSAEDMTFDQLLVFLSERQKIVMENGHLRAFRERMCTHGEHSH